MNGAQASLFDDLVGKGEGPLPVEEAYQLTGEPVGGGVYRLTWKIHEGYYLYRDKIKLNAGPDVEVVKVVKGAAKLKDDPLFGEVHVYYDSAELQVALRSLTGAPVDGTLEVEYQGCWEGGVCYPPVSKRLPLFDVPVEAAPLAATVASSALQGGDGGGFSLSLTDQQQYTASLAAGNLLLTVGLFLLAGLALSLTPCVFPMIPILASVIAGQQGPVSSARAFGLSLVYVLSMAFTYTLAGVFAGLFGENLQAAFQQPWIIVTFSLVFVLLAGAMFGFFELQMPQSVQNALNRVSRSQRGGQLTGVAVMGFLSALIVGPCVAAPLAGALIYIGQTGDPLLGGVALFALSMGMGLPLILIGTSAGRLLPRAGQWMNQVKWGFGIVLLLMAVWMLDRVVPAVVTMVLTGAVLVYTAIYLRALDMLPEAAGGWSRFGKASGILLLLYGSALLLGAAAGNRSMLAPLEGVVASPAITAEKGQAVAFSKVTSVAELEPILASAEQAGRPVMLDFYADWCVSCKELEVFTFADATVRREMGRFVLVKVDVTANDDQSKALYQRYGIIGPPALVFYDPRGKRLDGHMLVGVPSPEAFAAHLQKI
ncbi:protein-disulfide reductase DsbD [Motiliproteus sp. SC1-56]|uniref:protein-disulfide reductase DsbD n=1 Tax=Motiliproteus sp. SC1-56 TaxID=2799565 RepID=UPI001A905729|nr:protein-disulfide reductase DsbD [Motiliproteus sp. SC1-56]